MGMTTQDMVALRKARAIIEDVAPRTAFGRSVNYIEDRFDGNKCVLGYYEASENLSPSEREEYIVEACNYLNNLNEHFHVDGYHFDMSGVTEGKLYFAKDAEDWEDWTFNSSDGEYSYMEECAYRQYLANKAEVQHKLQMMVSEAVIIVDEESDYASKLNQLMSIQEGVTDSVSDAWTKFKNFLGKMWAKFTEFISRTLNSDKNYLTKYKDIILNKKYQLEAQEIDGDYFTGIERLARYQISTPTAQDIANIPEDTSQGDSLKKLQAYVFKDYSSGSSVEFADFVKNWFKGSKDGKENRFSLNESNVNMTDMYNFCFNYDKVRNTLNKNYGIMQKAGDSFISMAKDMDKNNPKPEGGTNIGNNPSGPAAKPEAKPTMKVEGMKVSVVDKDGKTISFADCANANELGALRSKVKADLDKGATPDVKALLTTVKQEIANQQKKQQAQQQPKQGNPQPHPQNASAFIATHLQIPVNEAVTSNGSSAGGVTTNKSGYSANANALGNLADKGNVNQHSGVNNVDAEGNVTASISRDQMGKDGDTLVKKVNNYTSVTGTVFAGMLTAAQTIHKDFMTIIKKHVQSYLGDKDSPDQAARAETNFGTNNTPEANQDTINNLRNIHSQAVAARNNNNQNLVAQLLAQATQVSGGKQFGNETELDSYITGLEQELKNKQEQAKNQAQAGNG